MSSHTQQARRRFIRPSIEGLETRELMSTAHVPVIAQLATAQTRTATTIPANGDANPYSVAFVPSGFPRGGPLNPGDMLVANFNNSDNLQGTGTTIVRVTPDNQTSVFYQGPPGVGFSNGLAILKRGFILVGAVPSTDGTPATVGQGEVLVLDRTGKLVAQFSDPNLLNGPWSLTVHDNGAHVQVYTSNILSGTVSRLDLAVPARGDNIRLLSATQIGSGFNHRGDPAAFELGPAGLAYDPKTDSLYVASSLDNTVSVIKNAGARRTDAGTGTVIYQDGAHLHGPVGLTFAPNGDLIAANSDGSNADPNQPSELVEFTRRGKFIGQFSIDPNLGGAFAVTLSTGRGPQLAAVDDVTGTVQVFKVKP